ncbi:hypothetical protein YC2023_023045 [Brassica napus]
MASIQRIQVLVVMIISLLIQIALLQAETIASYIHPNISTLKSIVRITNRLGDGSILNLHFLCVRSFFSCKAESTCSNVVLHDLSKTGKSEDLIPSLKALPNASLVKFVQPHKGIIASSRKDMLKLRVAKWTARSSITEKIDCSWKFRDFNQFLGIFTVVTASSYFPCF